MKTPVLLVGIHDAEIQAVSHALEALGCPYLFLETRAPLELALSNAHVAWRLGDPAFEIELAPGASAARPFAAVYTRLLALAPTHPCDSPYWTRETIMRATFYDREILALKVAFLQDLQRNGIPMYNGVALEELEVKAFRLIRLMEAGLPVPESVFTQAPASVRRLARRHARLVYKPVTGGTQAHVLTPHDLRPDRLGLLARAPVAFQELMPGQDLRVYVCDGEVLSAVLIHSDREVDSRRCETGYEPVAVSAELARSTVTACTVLGLRFSAVDLRLQDTGRFAVLECNNYPMFANIDHATGGQVARGLARRLAAADAGQTPG